MSYAKKMRAKRREEQRKFIQTLREERKMQDPNGDDFLKPGNGNGNGGAPEAPPPSRVIVDFAALGSAEFSLHTERVTPAQLIALAAWLDWYARKNFDQVAQAQKQNRIAVPGLNRVIQN